MIIEVMVTEVREVRGEVVDEVVEKERGFAVIVTAQIDFEPKSCIFSTEPILVKGKAFSLKIQTQARSLFVCPPVNHSSRGGFGF